LAEQGGYQIREDIKAGRISDATSITHLLRIPREDVTAKYMLYLTRRSLQFGETKFVEYSTIEFE
jgi:hypothetical protein